MLVLLSYALCIAGVMVSPANLSETVDERLSHLGRRGKLLGWLFAVLATVLAAAVSLFLVIPALDLFWTVVLDGAGVQYETMWDRIFPPDEPEVVWVQIDYPAYSYEGTVGFGE